jgi:hypothetical protein
MVHEDNDLAYVAFLACGLLHAWGAHLIRATSSRSRCCRRLAWKLHAKGTRTCVHEKTPSYAIVHIHKWWVDQEVGVENRNSWSARVVTLANAHMYKVLANPPSKDHVYILSYLITSILINLHVKAHACYIPPPLQNKCHNFFYLYLSTH